MSNMGLTILRSRHWGHGQKREHHNVTTVFNKINPPQQDCRLFKIKNGNCPYSDFAHTANLDMYNLKFQKKTE